MRWYPLLIAHDNHLERFESSKKLYATLLRVWTVVAPSTLDANNCAALSVHLRLNIFEAITIIKESV